LPPGFIKGGFIVFSITYRYMNLISVRGVQNLRDISGKILLEQQYSSEDKGKHFLGSEN